MRKTFLVLPFLFSGIAPPAYGSCSTQDRGCAFEIFFYLLTSGGFAVGRSYQGPPRSPFKFCEVTRNCYEKISDGDVWSDLKWKTGVMTAEQEFYQREVQIFQECYHRRIYWSAGFNPSEPLSEDPK